MPPKIADSSKINIATYSDTNIGKLKHIYRKGLSIRYGKTMQCVSGVHFNFSLTDNSLAIISGSNAQQDIDKAYLGLIRNFKRLFWFVLCEFGHSSVIDKSFVDGRDNDLEPLNDYDLFKKGATSLRMSEIGYQSKAQKNLNIKYNDLDEFLDEVKSAITTPYPEFENLGLKDSEGEFHQISSGILQIENELYDCIRPKRAGSSGERPYELLKKEGIKYLEVRGIDLDPEDLAGISKDKILLLDLIMLYCAIKPSSLMSDEEKSVIESNDIATIKSGRLPETIISYKDQPTTIAESRIDVIKDLMQIAAAMNDPKYIEVISNMNTKVNIFNPDKSFHNLGLKKARENSLDLKSNMEIDTHKFKEEAEASLLKFKKIQATANFDKIDEFMNSYNTKI
jgi:glutamate--cysteine ligase